MPHQPLLRRVSITCFRTVITAITLSIAICQNGLDHRLAGQEPNSTPEPESPAIQPASDEAENAIREFRFPSQLKCEVFAAEPDVANIVAFHRDFQGRLFACETFRQERGVEDNRSHGHWLDEDLAAQTVQDRIDYIRKHIADADESYTRHDDRIRLLVDTDGDGRADQSTVYSDHYNAIEMGTGAGVLSYRNNVYYTCIPSLFLLHDQNQDGVADNQLILHDGFGVRFAFRGHDMHGLIVGPDGRLYFSIGDRGYNVDRQRKDPASGAVFRCDFDGRNLEVLHTGLRNPQELAFDDHGNLFTGDNNSDSGDRARFTEILKGADSGWRMYYQYLPDRGPFNREKIWYPFNAKTPAYILPPIANISDGPSGLEYYPGTGFGDRFAGCFLLCDFRGQAANSGIRSFRHQLQGASWKLVDYDQKPFWNMLITDLDFGSDGHLYVSDWVFGWQGVNKGRIYRFHDPQHVGTELVAEVESRLREGLKNEPIELLVQSLNHADQRIRRESQFELVRRNAIRELSETATAIDAPQFSRIHALWGLGQLVREGKIKSNQEVTTVCLGDEDPQVVIAALRLAAESPVSAHMDVVKQLKHDHPRVRFEAAMALNSVGTEADVDAVAMMLADNADRDPTLRHGGIMALAGIFSRAITPKESAVAKLAMHDSASVRLATCVAMRKLLQSNLDNTYLQKRAAADVVAALLQDADQKIVLEAARVIHDVPVDSQMKALAALAGRMESIADNEPLVRRVLNANFRIGTQAAAQALASAALVETVAEPLRIDALESLAQWSQPPAKDKVLNDWRPLPANQRNILDARNALDSVFGKLISGTDDLASAAIAAAGQLKLTAIGPELLRVATSTEARESVRVSALLSLDRLNRPEVDDVLEQLTAQADSLPSGLLATAVDLLASRKPESALPLIEAGLNRKDLSAQQSLVATLGKMKDSGSKQLLSKCLAQMMKGQFRPGLRLDVASAVQARDDEQLSQQLDEYRQRLGKKGDLMARYQDCLVGGNAKRGRQIFIGKTEVSCVRCHRVGKTGGEVGPDLSGIGRDKKREYLLEAILEPNKVIAEGFAQTKIMTFDGELKVGLIKKETEEELVLIDADAKEFVVKRDDIDAMLPGESSMPIDLYRQLSDSEMRDLIEFLATRKSAPSEAGSHGE